MTDTVIAAHGLTKRFGKVAALDGLDLDVPRGASLGILGPAGAGKSTLVRLLAGLVRPAAGTLTVAGAPAGSVAARRRMGVVLQEGQLYDWMTVREALAFAADLAGMSAAEMAARIDDVATRLSVRDVLDRRAASLDPPTRGRVAVAQALVGNPDLLVLDEPFARLSPEGRRDVLGVLAALRGTVTILLAAQRAQDVEALCGRLAVLDAGRITLAASMPDLAHRVPRAFVLETRSEGSPALDGLIARLRSEPWVIDVAVMGGTLRVVVADEAIAGRELLAAAVEAGVPVAAFRREPRSIEGLVAGLPRS